MKQDSYTYSVVLTPAEEGGFVVSVPALPECHTEGDTLAEALANAKECIELCVECRLAEGEEIPLEISPIATSIITISPAAQYA